MNQKKLTLLLIFLGLFYCDFVQAQTLKSALLKNTGSIPLPTEDLVSVFLTVDLQPEIIGTIKVPVAVDMSGIALIASRLDKGKLVMFGTDSYFKSSLLKERSVQQLIINAIYLNAVKKSKREVAVTKQADKALLDFLKSQKIKYYETQDFKLKKGTNLLFLTEDVTDTIQRNAIETFIRAGGTLAFGSPYQSLNKISEQTPGAPEPSLALNSLFAKAGVINRNIIGRPKNTFLNTADTVSYLHINTMLADMTKSSEKTEIDRYVAYFLTEPTMDMIFKYNSVDAPVMKMIKSYFQITGPLSVPSVAHPVVMNSEAKRMGMKMAYRFYNLEQDFFAHSGATFPGYESFPGKVADGAARTSENITIPVLVGTQGLLDPPSVYYRPHSTGLYIPAGEKVKIIIPPSYINQHLKAQIGVHDDDLTHLDELTRIGTSLNKIFDLEKEVTEVYSPFGGLLLINISDSTTLKTVNIQVNGAVKAPYFKLGETSEAEWNATIRNHPAPWAELATNNIILTVPSYRIRSLSNPVKLMEFWDEVMDADADLAIISRDRVHQERLIVDRQPAYGYMFTMPTKIVVPDDESTEWMLDVNFIRKKGSWGAFHELGHRHQFWGLDYPGTGEVTVNLFSMYVYDKVLKKGIYNHENIPDFATVVKKIKAYMADKPSYEKWSADPFLALSMYIQIIDHFGWEPIFAANTTYRQLPKESYPKTDQEKRDLWFDTICKATNSNLTRFFDTWKIPVSDAAKARVKALNEWFPKDLE
jgi:hypothetical protein